MLPSTSLDGHPVLPDRHRFQLELSEINSRIEKCHEALNLLVGRHGKIGELSELKSNRAECKRKLVSRKAALREHYPHIELARSELAEKKTQIDDLENNDLMYKNEDRLDTKLKEMQERYNSGRFTNVRDEQVLVKEIDKLRRNKAKLSKYQTTVEQKRFLEDRLKELQDSRRLAVTNVKLAHYRYRTVQNNVVGTIRRENSLRNEAEKFRSTRRRLIENYERQRKEYMVWKNNNNILQRGKRLAKSASLPPSRKQFVKKASFIKTADDSDSELSEDEKLEPFLEQKRNCRYLIDYLNSLLQQLDSSSLAELDTGDISSTLLSINDRTESAGGWTGAVRTSGQSFVLSDSTEDLSEMFSRLRRPQTGDEKTEGHGKKSSKKSNKKSSKKANQSISHSMAMYQCFSDLDLSVPAIYQDIPMCIASVTSRLSFFNAQTSLCQSERNLWTFEFPLSERTSIDDDSCSNATNDSGAWGSFYSTDLSEHATSSLGLDPSSSQGSNSSVRNQNTHSLLTSIDSPFVDDDSGSSTAIFTATRLHHRFSEPTNSHAMSNNAHRIQSIADEGIETADFGSKNSSTNSGKAPSVSRAP